MAGEVAQSSVELPQRVPVGRLATLGLPVFNEGTRIQDTLILLRETALDTLRRYEWEILVVDDGSRDGSIEEIVSVATKAHLPLRLLAHDVNQGLGAALSTIFRESRGDLVVTVDADLTYSAEHVTRLVLAWESTKASVVVGSPYAVGGSTVAVPRRLEARSRAANRYLAAMTGERIATFTGVVRAYDGDFVRSLPPLRGGSFANVEVLYEAWRQHRQVVEIPACLDWSGQFQRRRRHHMLNTRTAKEVVHVLAAGRKLGVVARRLPVTTALTPDASSPRATESTPTPADHDHGERATRTGVRVALSTTGPSTR